MTRHPSFGDSPPLLIVMQPAVGVYVAWWSDIRRAVVPRAGCFARRFVRRQHSDVSTMLWATRNP